MQRRLLALLAVRAGRVVSADQIGEVLALGSTGAVRTSVSRLRRVVGDVVTGVAPGYVLDPGCLDVRRFEDLLRSASAARPEDRITLLDEALGLWRGSALVEFADEGWARGEAARLDELQRNAVEDRIEALLTVGRPGEAVADAEALIADHPLRERARGLQMRGLVGQGRAAEALRAYQDFRQHLGEHTGLEPSRDLVQLEQRIFRGETTTLPFATTSAEAPPRSTSTSGTVGSPAPMPIGLVQRADAIPMVGRESELERLTTCWKAAVDGERHVVFVSGEPGVGKSRLAAEVAKLAAEGGGTVLFGRCDEGVGIAYQPFAEALGDYVRSCPVEVLRAHLATFGGALTGMVPEVSRRVSGAPVPGRSGPDGGRRLLFDAATALLARAAQESPVLLVLDDLQWASKPTLLLLRHLVRASQPAELLVIAVFRDTDVDRAHPLTELLADLRRETAATVRMTLEGLTEDDLVAFVEAAAGQRLDDAGVALAVALHAATEGNPFFASEVLRHLTDTGVVRRRGGRWVSDGVPHDLGVPDGVLEVVGRRLARLSANARSALAVAAVIGAEFELEVVEEVARLSTEEVLDAVEEVIAARLVVEVPGAVGRCRFSHALVRQTLDARTSSARRAFVHRRVAEALEKVHAADIDAVLQVVAYHHAEGAPAGGSAAAVDYALRAGAEALRRTAFEEAETIFERGLSALDADPIRDDVGRFELLMSLADAQIRVMAPAFRSTMFEAAAMARRLDSPEKLARTAARITRRLHRFGLADPEVEALCEEALVALGDGDDRLRAQVLAGLAYRRSNSSGWEDALPLARDAMALARRSGDPEAQYRAAFSLNAALEGTSVLDERYRAAQDYVTLGRDTGVPFIAAMGMRSRSWVHLSAGDRARYERDIDELRQYAERKRIPELQATAAQGRALLAALDGRFDEVEALADAVLVFSAGEPNFLAAHAAQLGNLRFERGRIAELVPGAGTGSAADAEGLPMRAPVAHFHAHLGDDRKALAILEALVADRCARLRRDVLFPSNLAFLTSACAMLDHRASVPTLRELVAPYSGQLVVIATGLAVVGAADRYLAMLETVAGDFAAAAEHFQLAAELEARVGGVPLVARTRYWHARMLTTRDDPADRNSARELLAACMDTTTRLGMAVLQRQARDLVVVLDRANA